MGFILRSIRNLFLIGLATPFLASLFIDLRARPYIYTDLEDLPEREVALVLGTSPKINGVPNVFYTTRIAAARSLYEADKVSHILASGDNSTQYYNEPGAMQDDLVDNGVPADSITMDYAGLRTLDSVVRADEIFGQKSFVIVSQRFHAERAVFLARSHGLDAIAYCAENVPMSHAPKVYLREYGARIKALLDTYVLDTRPRFLGEPVDIDADQAP
ncbi:MAG: hypothetical protein RhofKO_19760 [Rhodothermales bacterium]